MHNIYTYVIIVVIFTLQCTRGKSENDSYILLKATVSEMNKTLPYQCNLNSSLLLFITDNRYMGRLDYYNSTELYLHEVFTHCDFHPLTKMGKNIVKEKRKLFDSILKYVDNDAKKKMEKNLKKDFNPNLLENCIYRRDEIMTGFRKYFDLDKDDMVSVDEIITARKKYINWILYLIVMIYKEPITEIMRKCDKDGDGKISVEDFNATSSTCCETCDTLRNINRFFLGPAEKEYNKLHKL